MRTKIIEKTIEDVIGQSNYSNDFKNMFIAFIKNNNSLINFTTKTTLNL